MLVDVLHTVSIYTVRINYRIRRSLRLLVISSQWAFHARDVNGGESFCASDDPLAFWPTKYEFDRITFPVAHGFVSINRIGRARFYFVDYFILVIL